MSEPRIVKRYANRKLYDTQSSHYVTLDQIAEMIRTGEEVRILDNTSKEDLTSVTLAQIILEEEKKQKSFLPLGAMRHIIQSGGASLSELAQEAQARVRRVFRKEDGDTEGVAPESVEVPIKAREEEKREDKKEEGTTHHGVRELLERSQHTFEDFQRKVDERLRGLKEAISPFAALEKEVAQLRERVERLEQHLRLESQAVGPDAGGEGEGP